MSNPQADLSRRVQDLERSRRRWKGLALGMLALLAFLLIAGVGLGVVQRERVQAERARALEAEQAARQRLRQAEAERVRREAPDKAEQGQAP